MKLHFEKKKASSGTYPGTSLDPLPHLHSHLELILMKKGTSRAIAGNKEVLFEAGDLFIAFPNQVHFYLDICIPQDHQVIYLSPDILPEFTLELENFIPVSPLLKNAINNPTIVSSFENLVEILKTKDKEYRQTELKGHSLLFFSELFRCMPLKEFISSNTTLLENVIHYCQSHYAEDITLTSMAKAISSNQFYISRLFNEQLHLNFRDYINNLRIEKACELLKNKQRTITEIAYEVGYSSMRTFHRSFQKIEGMTPKEYRVKLQHSSRS